MLRKAGWWLVTDVSVQPTCPTSGIKHSLVHEETAWPLKILLETWRYCLTPEDISLVFKMGPIGYPETSVTTNVRYVTTQNPAAEIWNHARIILLWHLEVNKWGGVRNHSPHGVWSQLKKNRKPHTIPLKMSVHIWVSRPANTCYLYRYRYSPPKAVVTLWKTNGEFISVRKHNYNCMLDDGIY